MITAAMGLYTAGEVSEEEDDQKIERLGLYIDKVEGIEGVEGAEETGCEEDACAAP